MTKLVSVLLLLSMTIALGCGAGINILPRDAANELKDCAWRAGWYAANIRKGYRNDASNDMETTMQRANNFKEKMEGIISAGTVDNIREMFIYASWHTANTRAGYSSDARRDRDRVNNLYNRIRNSGELSTSLVNNIREMGWAAAWHCANTRVGYTSDARRDKERFNDYSKRISGDVALVDVKFGTIYAPIITPKEVFQEEYVNCGSTTSKSNYKYTETMGKTTSYTHQVGFEYKISNGFSAGINYGGVGAGVTFEASFTFSRSSTFSQSLHQANTREFAYEFLAAPHTTNNATGHIYEARGSVQYQLVFDFQGVKKTVEGTWYGVAVTKVKVRKHEVKLPLGICPQRN